jgi:hypothetical protein
VWRLEEKVASVTRTSSAAAAHPVLEGSITFLQLAVLKEFISLKKGDERSSAVYSGNLVTGEM